MMVLAGFKEFVPGKIDHFKKRNESLCPNGQGFLDSTDMVIRIVNRRYSK